MNIKLTNTEFNFSYFNNVLTTEPAGALDLNQLIEIIQHGYLKDEITELRQATDKEVRGNIKRSRIPAVTLSGIFTERNSRGLQQHSGLMQIDIDSLTDYQKVFDQLKQDPYTYVCFRSPSGSGIKVIVKTLKSEDTHVAQFNALEQYYLNTYNIIIDKACKDVSRLMLLSWDPDMYCHPKAEVFKKEHTPQKPKPVHKKILNKQIIPVAHGDATEIIEHITAAVEEHQIDITQFYGDWIRMGYALATELGEEGRSHFHRISSFHPEYKADVCDRKFDYFISNNNGSARIGSLIYQAKEYGLDLQLPGRIHLPKEKETVMAEPDPVYVEKPILEQLHEKRAKIAKSKKCPPHLIVNNETLIEMADKLPTTQEEFIAIKGIGLQKTEQYAPDFLPVIRKHKGIKGRLELKFTQKFKEQQSDAHKLNTREKECYEALRALRRELSKEAKLSPGYVFSNNTLMELIQRKPKTKEELLVIKGIGKRKVDWFGQDIINILDEEYVE
ncbi:hypothetical protein E7Z59_11575 [Robertkochia marina]|uniref:HRDC domain-containing protein n=1 Tax=Robertkochia marina TaxID=1227945 RepID=A0A4S3LXZ4_9FLAO|nr:HRDC domain-containing protein [Robertkochia marina]THD66439.1 hypothetical protein E7Z59_11575 [Robertkochia marina]TRZ44116.1 hypothetical protein D3A96_09385 [Robertkochia marina]